MSKLNLKAFLLILLLNIIFESCKDHKDDTVDATKTASFKLNKILDPSDLKITNETIVTTSNIIKKNNNFSFNTKNNYTLSEPIKSIISFGKKEVLNPQIITLKDVASTPIKLSPESAKAKEMAAKQFNAESITYFDKLQGLKQSFVASLLNDSFGNLWFGTHGGGVTRYDGNYFTHFTEKEGLAGNSIFSMIQAKDQNLWFGTFGKGLSIFDGVSFKNISTQNGFPSDNIYSILQDTKGMMWIGTNKGGLIKMNPNNTTSIEIYNTKNGFFSDNITTLIEDKNGILWVGSEDAGFAKFDYGSFMRPNNKNLSLLAIGEFSIDNQGNTWIASYGDGLFKIVGQDILEYKTTNGMPSDKLTSLEMDAFSNLWVGTDGSGVIKLSNINTTKINVSILNAGSGLSNDNVYSIIQDNGGTMWFGTNRGGINKYNGNKFSHILDKNVYSFTQDLNQNVWVCTNEDGIIKYTLNESKTGWKIDNTITTSEGLAHDKVYTGFTDHKGKIWFGTSNGISIIEENKITNFGGEQGLCGRQILTIFQDKNKQYWFGMGEGEGIATYDGKNLTCIQSTNKIFQSAVFTIAEDNDGRLWFGTESDGIIIKDMDSFYKFDEKLPFNKNAVFSILKDKDGLLWIGTEGHGIFVYDGKSFYNINEKSGLSNNFVFSILEDSNKNLWFGTRFGLSILDKNKKEKLINNLKTNRPVTLNDTFFKTYQYQDGFLGLGCNRNAIFQSFDNNVWIGTTDRLTLGHLFNAENDITLNKKPLKLFISHISLYNEKVHWIEFFNKNIQNQKLDNGVNIKGVDISGLTKGYQIPESVSLRHDNNYLTFHFTAITQNQPWKTYYQYKIDRVDSDWSSWSTDNTAHYSHLHPGVYILSVRARDHEGNQSQVVTYTFDIRNPWWFSWWMKLLYLTSIIAIFYLIHKNQKNKTIKNERLKSQAKELEHAKEIEKAYTELKQTQEQLIQSEKMASLGELTAGIAHEIQNPLNFVNNFSELNKELLQELNEEIEKRNFDEVKVLAQDIIINEEKIHNHGKRADNIVKSMLMHSRASTGKKELTDINNLCNEYLSLVYHGLRAKDKSFNTAIETNFDPNVPKVNLVPQEIGRVILNITTNALHTVNDKSKTHQTEYRPLVMVTTKKINNNVIISISDNGMGISKVIKNKIFQPFFTTKPTGQGTGLGLSMAYDIIKAHDGTLEVESTEGEGSIFKITLPIYT
jgi:ligand-binding sensor domain-containing protein/signal transduction histidine kinase